MVHAYTQAADFCWYMEQAEFHTAAFGASRTQGIVSMISDLGFTEELVLVIDARATEHILDTESLARNTKMQHT